MASETATQKSAEAIKFLERDFSLCFEQMRHYYDEVVDICKFACTGYITVVGAALALYKYGVEKGINYSVPAAAILALAALCGFMLLGLVVRNRHYFVQTTRYINEHRRLFLEDKPLGFANVSGMYVDPTSPPYFNPCSSHAWLIYLLAALHAGMLTGAAFLFWPNPPATYEWCVWLAVGVFLAQLVPAVVYLRER